MDFEIYMSKIRLTTTSFENFYRLILTANEALDDKKLTIRQHDVSTTAFPRSLILEVLNLPKQYALKHKELRLANTAGA